MVFRLLLNLWYHSIQIEDFEIADYSFGIVATDGISICRVEID